MMRRQKEMRINKLNPRAKSRQNLLVAALNVAIERKLIALECELVTKATYEFALAGLPIIAYVNDAGFDEVAVNVICCPTPRGRETIFCSVFYEWRKFGEASTFGWLERRSGKYLQSGVNYHGTKETTAALAALTVKPLGFGTQPIKGGYDFHLEFENVFGSARRKRRTAA